MASTSTILILFLLASSAIALSIPTDDVKTDVLHYQPQQLPASHQDVKIRVKRQRNRNRNRNRNNNRGGGGVATIQGVSQPFCDKFGCRNQQQQRRGRCGNGQRFDSRTNSCRRVRNG